MKRILLIILFCFISMSFHDIEVIPQQTRTEVQDTSFLHKELNDSTLYLALEYYNIKHPRIVLAQAKLESGNYTSDHCTRRNNLFGLYNSKRKEYYSFDHWTDCIEGYKNMIEYKHKDGEDYYDFLIRIKYATDPTYVDKVKRIENNLEI